MAACEFLMICAGHSPCAATVRQTVDQPAYSKPAPKSRRDNGLKTVCHIRFSLTVANHFTSARRGSDSDPSRRLDLPLAAPCGSRTYVRAAQPNLPGLPHIRTSIDRLTGETTKTDRAQLT